MLSGYGKRDDAVPRCLVQWNELLAPTITKKTRGEIWPGGSALGSYLSTRDHGSSGKGLSPQRQQGCWVLETMGWARFVCPQLQFLQCICAKHAWEVISCSQFLRARNVGIALQKAFMSPGTATLLGVNQGFHSALWKYKTSKAIWQALWMFEFCKRIF